MASQERFRTSDFEGGLAQLRDVLKDADLPADVRGRFEAKLASLSAAIEARDQVRMEAPP